jgi:hypothetical protein
MSPQGLAPTLPAHSLTPQTPPSQPWPAPPLPRPIGFISPRPRTARIPHGPHPTPRAPRFTRASSGRGLAAGAALGLPLLELDVRARALASVAGAAPTRRPTRRSRVLFCV